MHFKFAFQINKIIARCGFAKDVLIGKNMQVIALKIDNVIQSDKIPFQTTHQLQDINKDQNTNSYKFGRLRRSKLSIFLHSGNCEICSG
jgi:hypothetical protein